MSKRTAAFVFRFFSVLMLLTLLVSAQRITPVRAAGECYVKWNATGGNDGTSWTDAYTDLQSALGASTCTEVWVAAGTYKPTTAANRFVTFLLKSGVALYGGFKGLITETARTDRDPAVNVTILSGDLNGDDIGFTNNSENTYHVVTGATGATLDGFTVTAGNANGPYPSYNGGGGMYNFGGSSPSLTNVAFNGNSAVYNGGGMYNYSDSNPALTNVTFSGNSATDDGGGGGGMYNYDSSSPTLTNVTFISNTAYLGGGMCNYNSSSPSLTDVTFSDNSAFLLGGGMLNHDDNNYNSSPTLTNVTFSSNSARYGGGVYNQNGSLALSLTSFLSNTANNSGGGLYASGGQIDALDSDWRGNAAFGGGGGGIRLADGSQLTLTHSLFYTNTAPSDTYGGGGILIFGGVAIVIDSGFYTNTAGGNGGGGIASTGDNDPSSLTVVSSTFAGNRAVGWGEGGAIYSNGYLSVQDSTFSDNATTGTPGGSGRNGGGVMLLNGVGVMTNTTFSGNRATGSGGGLAYRNDEVLTLTHVTIAGNIADSTNADLGDGGGVYVYGGTTNQLALANTIIAGNVDNSPAAGAIYTDVLDASDSALSIQSLGYNLIGTTTGATIASAVGDQFGDDLIPIDPLLTPLADNGGPTWTRALDNGSAALEKIPFGANGCGTTFTTDQRGYARPGDRNQPTNKCEIGAWEAQIADPTAVTLRDLTATANTSPGVIGAVGAAFAALAAVWVGRRRLKVR